MLLCHIIPMTLIDHTWFGLPFATQKYENGTAIGLELIVDQITLYAKLITGCNFPFFYFFYIPFGMFYHCFHRNDQAAVLSIFPQRWYALALSVLADHDEDLSKFSPESELLSSPHGPELLRKRREPLEQCWPTVWGACFRMKLTSGQRFAYNPVKCCQVF